MDESGNDDARFDALIAALEAQADAVQALDDDIATAEMERAAWGEVTLLDRLRAMVSGQTVVIDIIDHGPVGGEVIAVGSDVVVLAADDGEWAIPMWGISGVIGAGAQVQSASLVAARLGLVALVRSWSRERSVVRVIRRGSQPLDGTIDRVGADHIDLAEHDPGVPRRPAEVRRVIAVSLIGVSALRRR